MLKFVCDYAKASPAILANKIERFFSLGNSPVWCRWEDKDEDTFYITAYHPCAVEITPIERETIRLLVSPYLADWIE